VDMLPEDPDGTIGVLSLCFSFVTSVLWIVYRILRLKNSEDDNE